MCNVWCATLCSWNHYFCLIHDIQSAWKKKSHSNTVTIPCEWRDGRMKYGCEGCFQGLLTKHRNILTKTKGTFMFGASTLPMRKWFHSEAWVDCFGWDITCRWALEVCQTIHAILANVPRALITLFLFQEMSQSN